MRLDQCSKWDAGWWDIPWEIPSSRGSGMGVGYKVRGMGWERDEIVMWWEIPSKIQKTRIMKVELEFKTFISYVKILFLSSLSRMK